MNLKNHRFSVLALLAGLVCLILLMTGAWLVFSPENVDTSIPMKQVSLWAYGQEVNFSSSSSVPADWLKQAGIDLQPSDLLLIGGQKIDPLAQLPSSQQYYLQYQPAVDFELTEDGRSSSLRSSAATLGEALWEVGLPLQPGDQISNDPGTSLLPGMKVEIQRAQPISIQTQAGNLVLRTASAGVGQALAEAGIALQGMDYSIPAEEQPLPDDGIIRVVRVTETVTLQQSILPFQNSYAPDPNLELDQRSILTPGQYGIKVSRERVRFEDNQEVSRETEAEWTAGQPVDQVVGYGTQVVAKSTTTPDGTIEYYRAVEAYATSYSPCQQGLNRCTWATSSGIPLAKGIVAVRLSWYRALKGSRVYIPGYGFGVIGDVGGGIPGRYWIDLGYSEEDFVSWSQTVTIYFLTPAPATVPALLQ